MFLKNIKAFLSEGESNEIQNFYNFGSQLTFKMDTN